MLKHPIILAFLATMGTWGMTAIGAAFVFFFKTINRHVMNGMLGFASGVMIAASFWSLLQPAIELAEGGSLPPWAVAAIGFLAGGAFLWLSDQLIPHAHLDSKPGESLKESPPTFAARSSWFWQSPCKISPKASPSGGDHGGGKRIPDDGRSVDRGDRNRLAEPPEGGGFPSLAKRGLSRRKELLLRSGLGVVEPIARVLGAWLVHDDPILPYALAFAAGAMIYVVIEELIPESWQVYGTADDHSATHWATIGTMLGFTIMMILDVALGQIRWSRFSTVKVPSEEIPSRQAVLRPPLRRYPAHLIDRFDSVEVFDKDPEPDLIKGLLGMKLVLLLFVATMYDW